MRSDIKNMLGLIDTGEHFDGEVLYAFDHDVGTIYAISLEKECVTFIFGESKETCSYNYITRFTKKEFLKRLI